jgi:hypothetical protein
VKDDEKRCDGDEGFVYKVDLSSVPIYWLVIARPAPLGVY